MPKTLFPLQVPQFYTIGKIVEGEPEPAPPPPVRVWIEVGPPGDDDMRRETGRLEPTALIYRNAGDGDHLVAILRPEDIQTILRVWRG